MKTFNKTELKASRTILKELLKKGQLIHTEVHVATVILRTFDILVIKGYETAGLKLNSFTEDEQEVARGISFICGYGEMHFAGDDYFSVVMDDFDFNSSAITKLLVELFKRELLEMYKAPNETHAEPYFDYISCCDIFGLRTKSKENCYKLAVKIVKEYLKEESTMEESTTTMAEVAQDTAQPASSEPSNEQLTAEIKVYLGQIGQNIIEIGKRLNIMKGRLQHGEWQNWLKDNFNLSYRMAAKFMQCAERFSKVPSKALFSQTQMVEMLALPEAETERFIEEKAAAGTPVEDMTVKKLREEIQQWKARAKDADKKSLLVMRNCAKASRIFKALEPLLMKLLKTALVSQRSVTPQFLPLVMPRKNFRISSRKLSLNRPATTTPLNRR